MLHATTDVVKHKYTIASSFFALFESMDCYAVAACTGKERRARGRTKCYACGCCMRRYHAYFIVKEHGVDVLARIPFFRFTFLSPVYHNNMDEYTKTSVDSNDILLKDDVLNNHEEEKPQLEEPRLERTMGMFSGVIHTYNAHQSSCSATHVQRQLTSYWYNLLVSNHADLRDMHWQWHLLSTSWYPDECRLRRYVFNVMGHWCCIQYHRCDGVYRAGCGKEGDRGIISAA